MNRKNAVELFFFFLKKEDFNIFLRIFQTRTVGAEITVTSPNSSSILETDGLNVTVTGKFFFYYIWVFFLFVLLI